MRRRYPNRNSGVTNGLSADAQTFLLDGYDGVLEDEWVPFDRSLDEWGELYRQHERELLAEWQRRGGQGRPYGETLSEELARRDAARKDTTE